jgi:pimeloyl-ACP methyl ester carboxylesterase
LRLLGAEAHNAQGCPLAGDSCLPARHTRSVPHGGDLPAFVLIHSPLVGPTTWSPAARELQRRRREAVVPSLLGVPDAPVPQWGHVLEAVQAATARIADPVVLVGHSGAGLLLPTLADRLSAEVAGMIFVDAFLPPARGSVPLATEIPGHPATDYGRTVLGPYENTGVRDQIGRLCIDGTAKFSSFLIPTIERQLDLDGSV